jgi:hypothetical protein
MRRGIRKMQFKNKISENISRNKRRILSKSTCSVALVLLLVLSSTLFLLPIANAATSYPVYCFIAATPNPAGLGQQVLISAFADRYPPSNASNRYAIYVDFIFDVIITDPAGTVTTTKLKSDPVGGSWMTFTPNQLGTYTMKMHFEGAGPISQSSNNTYLPGTSSTISLVVQQDAVPPLTGAPLPTGYWQRPINNENREWASIAGNWLGLNALRDNGASTWDGVNTFNPYTTAPNSAHIIWTKPLKSGGIAGMPYNDEGFYTGDSYERIDKPAIIMNGVYYRNIPQVNNIAGNGFEAIDLRTGQVLWTQTNGSITFGQLLMFDSMNQHGVIPYLWNSNLQCFDAENGNFLLSFANRTSGSLTMDQRGNIIQYTVTYSATQKYVLMWNSTQAIQLGVPPGQTGSAFGAGNPDYWRPWYGTARNDYNWSKGIVWNVTIPNLSQYGCTNSSGPSISMFDPYDKVIICRYAAGANDTYPIGYTVLAGFSMTDGTMLWVKNYTDTNIVETGALGGASVGAGPGYFTYFKQETMQWHIYNARTGQYLYATDPLISGWGTYYTTLSAPASTFAYDKFFTIGYDGFLHCYNPSNGNLLWSALGYSAGQETPYGSWPTSYIAIADGKVYVSNGEHSPNQPLYRGYRLYCVDANTGQLLWKVANYGESPIIADGYLMTFNGYDSQNYAFGKGLSATTVQTPLTGIHAGDTIEITGTVTDQSPGQTCLGIPAAGTPAISDDSMSAWMEYLYMQKVQPTNATGVPVQLVAIDSSGVSTVIGTVTSNSMGFFNTHWTVPATPSDYQIVANFAGSNSYFSSSAIAAVAVVGAAPTPASANDVASAVVAQLPPTASPVPTAPSASDVASQVVANLPAEDNTLLYAAIAIIIIAVLIGIVNLAVLMMRRKQAA